MSEPSVDTYIPVMTSQLSSIIVLVLRINSSCKVVSSLPNDVIMDFFTFIIEQFKQQEVIFKDEVRKLHAEALDRFKPDLKTSDKLLLNDFKTLNRKLKAENKRIVRGVEEETGCSSYNACPIYLF